MLSPRLGRRFSAGALLVLGLGVASCNAVGDYSVTWVFDTMTSPPGAFDCSSRGVGSIIVSVAQPGQTGQSETVIASDTFPCDTQPAAGILAPGTYDFTITGGDFQGHPLLTPVVVKAISVQTGQTAQMAVTLDRNSQCSDSIDNDYDGLIDLQDPGCGGDPHGDNEAAQ
jgi:hypothetical protein